MTSTSLMVRQPAAVDAVERARVHPDLAIGLHLDLGEWIWSKDEWRPVYSVVSLDDSDGVADEVDRQLDAFRAIAGRNPTHLDSHQHVHRREPLGSILINRARSLGVPIRHCTPGITYLGKFYGQLETGESNIDAISIDSLVAELSRLEPGVTEFCCHPAEVSGVEQGNGRTAYWAERGLELATLCDARVANAIRSNGIQLCAFTEFAARARS